MKAKTLRAAFPKAARPLLIGALLLATHLGYAQNSFNRWEAATPTPTPTTPRAARKTAVKSKPEAKVDKVQEEALAQAGRKAKDSLQVAQGKSITLRRGLGQRLRGTQYSKADAGFYEFAWQHLQYPPTALRAGLTGQVMVRLEVSPEGDVTNSVVTGDDIHQNKQPEKGASATAGREAMRYNAQQLLWGLRFESAPEATQEEIPVRYIAQ